MLATVFSSATLGVEAYLVEVEVDVARGGIPKFIVVGLPDAAVKESAERVGVALRGQGYRFPNTMEVVPPFTSATPDAVSERLTLHEPLAGGGHTTQTVAIDASRVSETLWRGTFSTTAILVKRHRWLDTCRLRT